MARMSGGSRQVIVNDCKNGVEGIAFCSSYRRFDLTPIRVSGVVLRKNNFFSDVVNFVGYFTVYLIFVNQNCKDLELSSPYPLEGTNTQQI